MRKKYLLGNMYLPNTLRCPSNDYYKTYTPALPGRSLFSRKLQGFSVLRIFDFNAQCHISLTSCIFVQQLTADYDKFIDIHTQVFKLSILNFLPVDAQGDS